MSLSFVEGNVTEKGWVMPTKMVRYRRHLGQGVYMDAWRKSPVKGKDRDQQKKRVYRCVHKMRQKGPHFVFVSDVQKWINQSVITDPWFKSRYPQVKYVIVNRGRGRVTASAGKRGGLYTICNLPQWSRAMMYVLHELAHVCVSDMPSHISSNHGPQYMREYVELVKHFAPQNYQEFMEQIHSFNVNVAHTTWIDEYKSVIEKAAAKPLPQIVMEPPQPKKRGRVAWDERYKQCEHNWITVYGLVNLQCLKCKIWKVIL